MNTRKIVAIGGGENGRLTSDGIRKPYETEGIDTEIVRLTGKENPNFLFLGHGLNLEYQEGYFITMEEIFGGRFGCSCKDLKSNLLADIESAKKLIEWADIIYEGGGDTQSMISLWKETGFDRVLKEAWESGKVMCGLSAGANCWFEKCSSDALKKYGDDLPLIKVNCLGFMKGLFVPHCDEPGRQESVKELLLRGESEAIGLLFSNCAALEIVDDLFRVLTSDASNYGMEKGFGKKTYWKEGKYIEKELNNGEFSALSELYSRL